MLVKFLVVVIVYNEEENIILFVECIKMVLVGMEYEFIYVDDGLMDNILKVLCEQMYDCLVVVEFC